MTSPSKIFPEKTVLSQTRSSLGRGNKGSGPDSPIKADAIKTHLGKIYFSCRSRPRGRPRSRAGLASRATAVEVQHPFYRSYDQ